MVRQPLRERVRRLLQDGQQIPATGGTPGARSPSFLRALVEAGTVSRHDMQRFLSEETGQPIVENAEGQTPPPGLPESFLKSHEVIAIDSASRLFGMVWPQDIETVDELLFRLGPQLPRAVICGQPMAPAVHEPADEKGDQAAVEALLDSLGGSGEEVQVVNTYDLLEEFHVDADEAPIVKLLNLIIVQACRENASDIHIEPEEAVSRVRYRVDGLLKECMLPPKRFHNALVSRIKIMSELDIAEKRTPQDGRMKLRLGSDNVDVRVSTIPSIFGEKVVMRILREGSIILDLDHLGFSKKQVEHYRAIIHRPYGIVLVTGPTGSGKTTTLYSTLHALNSKAKNIITLEDPVEYQMDNVNQIQVNRKAGIDFASGLKSILRQDPDIIMVGEMRDEETAAIAVKAALTGHLVFSTLHTNDAPGSYSRLQEMKVAPYLLASSISGVIAQRLVRVICSRCKVSDDRDEGAMRLIGLDAGNDVELYRGEGCSHCGGTGYRGRTALYEMLTPTREVKKMILAGQLEEGSQIPGFERMVDHGREKVLAGITSVEEVCRVVRMHEVF